MRHLVLHGKDPRSGRSWQVSLNTLITGVSRNKRLFRGRPELVRRLLPGIEACVTGLAWTSAKGLVTLMHSFWHFLDHLEDVSQAMPQVGRVMIDDLSWDELEAVWRQFINWLRSKPPGEMSVRHRYMINNSLHAVWRNAFDDAVQRGETTKQHLDTYVYFRDDKRASYGGDPLDLDEAQQVYKTLARAWKQIVRRVGKARALASTGRNPMSGSSGASRWTGGLWPAFENRLWVTARYYPCLKSTMENLARKSADGLSRYPVPEEWRIAGVDQSEKGVNAHLACLYLTRMEMAIALAMVTMKTGMNPDAVARMTVDAWCRPDAMQPEKRVILYGPKRNGNYNLRAASSAHRLTDPYQIIRRVIDIQAPLRERIRADAKRSGDPESKEQSELVWIFPNSLGEIVDFAPGAISSNKNAAAALLLLDKFFDACNLRRKNGSPMRYKFIDGRDIWGLFVYQKSGFNHILTAQALGHSSIAVLLHYLEKRSTMVDDRKRLIDLHERVITDLEQKQFNPRDYRQLADTVQPAATGLPCTDPYHPDADADPGNPGGRLCRTQACWTCTKWFATRESVPYLLRLLADLKGIRDVIPVAAWETSDYPLMLAVYEHIVSKFSHNFVDAEREKATSMPPMVSIRQFVGRRA